MLTLALVALLALPSASAGATTMDAHRGGPMYLGEPQYPENSRFAMNDAAFSGFRLEMDTRVTKDGVVVLMHDPLLDRTTDCSGPLRDKTKIELDECRIDVNG